MQLQTTPGLRPYSPFCYGGTGVPDDHPKPLIAGSYGDGFGIVTPLVVRSPTCLDKCTHVHYSRPRFLISEQRRAQLEPAMNDVLFRSSPQRSTPVCLLAALDFLARGWSPIALCPADHAGVDAAHERLCDAPGGTPLWSWKEYQQ